jgi:hypothetical protein
MAAPAGRDNAADRSVILELEAPIMALSAASGLLALAVAGVAARHADHVPRPWEGEALGYLADHIRDLAETAAAIHEGRPAGWRVAAPFRAVIEPEGGA